MASIDLKTITNNKIKFRFAEPYASEGANIQQGVNLPGAYRGALVEESSPSTDRSVWINRATGDADSIILHRDATNGYCTVVRETSNVELDCSTSLTWPIATETTLYIFMSISYSTGSDTTGYFEVVSTPGEVPANAVMLARVVLPAGATEILQEYIQTDGSKRDKVGRKKGVLVLKRVDYPTVGSNRTGFEITDKVCWLGAGSAPQNRVRLGQDGVLNGIPLMGSDGGQVTASTWYNIQGGTALSISDMDEDGCYTNPWIAMGFNDTVDTYNRDGFSAWYYAYVPFDEANVEDMNAGFFDQHTNSVSGRDSGGTPDSLSAGQLDSQLDDILDLINARIRTYNPESTTGPSDWRLLWRSNNVVADASVDNDTLSLYWSADGLLLAQGGYIDGTDFRVDLAGATGPVTVVRLYQRELTFMTGTVSTIPHSVSIGSSSSWTQYKESDGEGGTWYNNDCEFIFPYAKARMNATPDTSGNPLLMEILSLADRNIRVFWGGDSNTDNNELYICWGCRWDDGSSVWQKTSSAAFDAHVIAIGRHGISLKRKATTDSDYSTGWSSWTGAVSFDSILKMSGVLAQKFIVPFKAVLSEDMVRGMRDSSYNGPTINEVINLVFRRTVSPAGGITWTQLGSESLSGLPITGTSADDSDPAYIHVSGTLDIRGHLVSPTLQATACFVSSPATIITTTDIPLAVGQSIAVRGNINGSWIVKEITWNSPGMTILVEDEDGNNALPSGNASGNTAYVLDPADAGKEIIAFYTAEFSY